MNNLISQQTHCRAQNYIDKWQKAKKIKLKQLLVCFLSLPKVEGLFLSFKVKVLLKGITQRNHTGSVSRSRPLFLHTWIFQI